MIIDTIKCHGSGNRFVMVDAVARPDILAADLAALARALCAEPAMRPCDGVLYVVPAGTTYAMRMFNPDGSEAEMCGNGIRCVARLVRERYIDSDSFTLASGRGLYPISRSNPIFGSMPTFGAEMAIATRSDDFGFMAEGCDRFTATAIAEFDPALRFTALSPGNPHIVACVEAIDMQLLADLGERVKRLPHLFPRGINVSLYTPVADQAIFAATYERGAGITYSCGTAMTSCSTAAVLTGLCRPDTDIEVYNRGGMVRCRCHVADDGAIATRLTGNATYEWTGRTMWDGSSLADTRITATMHGEIAEYEQFARATAAKYPNATCR